MLINNILHKYLNCYIYYTNAIHFFLDYPYTTMLLSYTTH